MVNILLGHLAASQIDVTGCIIIFDEVRRTCSCLSSLSKVLFEATGHQEAPTMRCGREGRLMWLRAHAIQSVKFPEYCQRVTSRRWQAGGEAQGVWIALLSDHFPFVPNAMRVS